MAGAPLEAARSRLLLGRCLAAAGETDWAARTLTRAEAELAALGAVRDRDTAARELGALRVRPAPESRPPRPDTDGGRNPATRDPANPNPAGRSPEGRDRAGRRTAGRDLSGRNLSHRELQVARLVAAGRTDSQIASQLHITEPAVQTHLQRIFAKLRVSSRAAVAAGIAAVTHAG